jgi:hypothetical protein
MPMRRGPPVLARTTSKTSRLAEFRSRRELIPQTGYQVRDSPLVIVGGSKPAQPN